MPASPAAKTSYFPIVNTAYSASKAQIFLAGAMIFDASSGEQRRLKVQMKRWLAQNACLGLSEGEEGEAIH